MAAAVQASARPLRVALLWNGAVQTEQLVQDARPIVLGDGRDALFRLPDGAIEEDSVTLLEPEPTGFQLTPHPRMGGYVWLAGHGTSVNEIAVPVSLRPGDFGLVTFGSVTVFFQQVSATRGEVPRKGFRDGALIACLGLSVFVHVAAIIFFFFVAAREFAPVSGLELDTGLLSKYLIIPPPEELLALSRKSAGLEDPGLRDRDESGGKRAKDAEGKVGKRDAPNRRTEIAGAPADAVAQQVRGMGLLGVLSGGRSDAMENALDTKALDSLLGGLGSAQTQIGAGSGGMSLRGGGLGGGGTGKGVMFGAGELGTGVAGGKGLGKGGDGLGVKGREAREASLGLDGAGAHVSGFLSKEQINRVVQANRAAIKYCFEAALQQNPRLQGAVHAYWRIDRQGNVSTTRVAKSTLGDAKVEGCILRQIKRWKFPEPDGGEVEVTYPFLLRGQ
jgi:hypothetical protein